MWTKVVKTENNTKRIVLFLPSGPILPVIKTV